MKKLLFISLLFSLSASAQVTSVDTIARLSKDQNIKVDTFSLKFPGTSYLVLPQGTTAQRRSINATGGLRYNSDSAIYEFYNGTAWRAFALNNTGSAFISSLTTTGTSGAATVIAGVLNIPTPSGASGLTSLNTLTAGTQTFAIGTTGTDPNWVSATSTHTLHIPVMAASSVTTGLLSNTTQSIPGLKTFTGSLIQFTGVLASNYSTNGTATNGNFNVPTSASLSHITVAQYEKNSNPVSIRVGIRGSLNTVVTAGDDVAHFLIGANDFTEAATATVHPLASNFAVLTPTRTNGTATTTDFQTAFIDDAPTGGVNNWSINAGASKFRGKLTFDSLTTTVGTTGNQTINKPTGTVNIAAAGTTVTVTNSLVTATSIIYCVIRTNDATATGIKNVVPSAGSFVINLNASATAEVSIGFIVFN